MAAIYLGGLGRATPETEQFFSFFRERAARSARHVLAGHPAEADLILFVYGSDLRSPPSPDEERLLAERGEDCFVLDGLDRPTGFLPGLYAAMPAMDFDRERFRAYCYPAENRHVEEAFRAGLERTLLFSFLGSANCPVRRRLLRFGYDRPDIVVEDATSHQEWNPHQSDWEGRKRRYAAILAGSLFSLCPRGAGTGSIRMFEAMQAGSVPVVFSDRYVLPEGPDWDSFLLRLPERFPPGELPGFLEERRAGSREKGALARRAWEEWFSPEVWLDRIVEGIGAIGGERRHSEASRRRLWGYWKLRRQAREGAFNALRMARNKLLSR